MLQYRLVRCSYWFVYLDFKPVNFILKPYWMPIGIGLLLGIMPAYNGCYGFFG
jgi:hypothetical protein